jgi:beta-glucosidase/6-phospho-beta-glucosidase/beta-galactosidase
MPPNGLVEGSSKRSLAEPDHAGEGAFFPSLFSSYFIGGFECSSHRRRSGRRLDLLAATMHDRYAAEDYERLRMHNIRTVRDGLRWHLIERRAGFYDWSSFLPMLRAARAAGVQVIWDLCHYGWPNDIDIWEPAFVDRFARFAGAVARLVRDETEGVPIYCPVNEISYWAWAGGEAGRLNPYARGRSPELKRQLVRASIAGMEAVWSVDPRARMVHVDPVIHVTTQSGRKRDRINAEAYRLAQFEAWDMLSGRLQPELGGRPAYLDIIGVNYYSDNQWLYGGGTIPMGHHLYRPFSDLLEETYRRYNRPIFVAETGAEGSARAAWLHYVGDEVRTAIAAGVPVEGICLYPILDYPGWENDRHCEVGLYGAADGAHGRPLCHALADELHRQQAIMNLLFQEKTDRIVVTGGDG